MALLFSLYTFNKIFSLTKSVSEIDYITKATEFQPRLELAHRPRFGWEVVPASNLELSTGATSDHILALTVALVFHNVSTNVAYLKKTFICVSSRQGPYLREQLLKGFKVHDQLPRLGPPRLFQGDQRIVPGDSISFTRDLEWVKWSLGDEIRIHVLLLYGGNLPVLYDSYYQALLEINSQLPTTVTLQIAEIFDTHVYTKDQTRRINRVLADLDDGE